MECSTLDRITHSVETASGRQLSMLSGSCCDASFMYHSAPSGRRCFAALFDDITHGVGTATGRQAPAVPVGHICDVRPLGRVARA
eukprot:14327738-Alexandrium_andersonii.AAC.1